MTIIESAGDATADMFVWSRFNCRRAAGAGQEDALWTPCLPVAPRIRQCRHCALCMVICHHVQMAQLRFQKRNHVVTAMMVSVIKVQR